MTRCSEPSCLRAAMTNGAKCDTCTRTARSIVFRPEWVKRMNTGKQIPRGIAA